jgi:hypothetical protein
MRTDLADLAAAPAALAAQERRFKQLTPWQVRTRLAAAALAPPRRRRAARAAGAARLRAANARALVGVLLQQRAHAPPRAARR